MKRLAVLFAVMFALMSVPALAVAAPADSFCAGPSSTDSSCRARKRKAKKAAADNKGNAKGKKKGKDDKKPYGFEL